MFQVDGRWNQAEVIDVSYRSILVASLMQQSGTFSKLYGPAGTGCRAGRTTSTGRAAIRAQVALFGLVTTMIETDCAIRARQHAFLASGTAITVDLHYTGVRMFGDCVGAARPQTCRAAALLTDADQELEAVLRVCRFDPVDTVAKDAFNEAILELARGLA